MVQKTRSEGGPSTAAKGNVEKSEGSQSNKLKSNQVDAVDSIGLRGDDPRWFRSPTMARSSSDVARSTKVEISPSSQSSG